MPEDPLTSFFDVSLLIFLLSYWRFFAWSYFWFILWGMNWTASFTLITYLEIKGTPLIFKLVLTPACWESLKFQNKPTWLFGAMEAGFSCHLTSGCSPWCSYFKPYSLSPYHGLVEGINSVLVRKSFVLTPTLNFIPLITWKHLWITRSGNE